MGKGYKKRIRRIKRCGRCRGKLFSEIWFNRCCCNIKKSIDEVYKILNPK